MSIVTMELEQEALKALDILTRERAMSLSTREWRHRLTGYGYAIREGESGAVVTWLTRGVDLCDLPERLN